MKLVEYGPADRLLQIVAREISSRSKEPHATMGPLKIIDIGSGGAAYWEQILTKFGSAIDLTLVDPKRPANLSDLMRLSTVRHVSGVAPTGLTELAADSFDICTAFDLIEHLRKEDGYHLLYEIDRVTKGQSIVFTPNGFVWQAPSSNNPFNAHISGWTPRELRDLGWGKSRGHTGLRVLFGPYGLPKSRVWAMAKVASLTALLVRILPAIAFSFSAVKTHGSFEETIHNGLAE